MLLCVAQSKPIQRKIGATIADVSTNGRCDLRIRGGVHVRETLYHSSDLSVILYEVSVQKVRKNVPCVFLPFRPKTFLNWPKMTENGGFGFLREN